MDPFQICFIVFFLSFGVWYPLGKWVQDRRWRKGWEHKNIKESNDRG